MSQLARAHRVSLFSSTLRRTGFIPWLRFGGGVCHVTCPEWLYDLAALLFWMFNTLTAFFAARVPRSYNREDWPLDPALSPDKLPAPKRSLQELTAIVRRRDNTHIDEQDVWALFDSLPAPSANEMLGTWRGKIVFCGSLLALPGMLLEAPNRFIGCDWGKRFLTPYRGDPLVWVAWKRLVTPVLVWGNVSMPESSLRGKLGATMTYDHQPWKDHFRILDDGKISGRRMMLGTWTSREKNGGWFTLEELPELDEPIKALLVESPYPMEPELPAVIQGAREVA